MVKEVKTQCTDCEGTGLYSGFCEPEGTAVVCCSCEGTGCYTFRYTPFEKRRGKKGIKTVRLSRGTFIATGVGAMGKEITYKEFQAGKFPTKE